MKTHGKRKRFRELDRDRVREGQGVKGSESERDRPRKRFRKLDRDRVREGQGDKGIE